MISLAVLIEDSWINGQASYVRTAIRLPSYLRFDSRLQYLLPGEHVTD